jgi:hypothetical protein
MRGRAPSAPFEPVSIIGESVTVETKGKILVLPTGHPYLLPLYNEYCIGRATQPSGTYTFTNDFNSNTGLKNLIYPWIALYDPQDTEIDFYLFSYSPQKLEYTVKDFYSETGAFLTSDLKEFITADQKTYSVKFYDQYITQLKLFPGNGIIYHGRLTYADLTRESNSDLIPDFLDINKIGSLTRFLQSYSADGLIKTTQFLTSDLKEFKTSNSEYLFVRA